MKLFMSVDEKLKEIGFNKITEDKYGVFYKRFNENFVYPHCVHIAHKASGKHIIQSYDSTLNDTNKIGNTCVGLTGYEMKLFLRKMKQAGLYSK